MEKGYSLPTIIKKLVRFLPTSLFITIYHWASNFSPIKSLINTIVRSQIPNSIKIEEGEILLDKNDVAVSGSLALGIFEKEEISLFRKKIKPNMVFVDIGANLGLYTVIAASRIGPNGKVFAYEPEIQTYALLEKNIKHNQFKNITPIRTALDNKSGTRVLYLAKDNKGHNSFSKDKLTYKQLNIATETLDQSLQKYGSPIVDIIKMDIEGAEPLALEGMQETIKKNPNIIIGKLNKLVPSFIKSYRNMSSYLIL
jgi:FkbM family methyltransferase